MKLSVFCGQISSLGGRVWLTETALAGKTTDLIIPTSAASDASNYANNATSIVTGAIASTSISENLNVAQQNLLIFLKRMNRFKSK